MALAHGGLLSLRVMLLEVILAPAAVIELKRLQRRSPILLRVGSGPPN